jgi:hypothetical protein
LIRLSPLHQVFAQDHRAVVKDVAGVVERRHRAASPKVEDRPYACGWLVNRGGTVCVNYVRASVGAADRFFLKTPRRLGAFCGSLCRWRRARTRERWYSFVGAIA